MVFSWIRSWFGRREAPYLPLPPFQSLKDLPEESFIHNYFLLPEDFIHLKKMMERHPFQLHFPPREEPRRLVIVTQGNSYFAADESVCPLDYFHGSAPTPEDRWVIVGWSHCEDSVTRELLDSAKTHGARFSDEGLDRLIEQSWKASVLSNFQRHEFSEEEKKILRSERIEYDWYYILNRLVTHDGVQDIQSLLSLHGYHLESPVKPETLSSHPVAGYLLKLYQENPTSERR